MSDKELTQKEELFCEFYIEEFNGADAARRAGYSENSARQIASENLSKPYIKAYISKIQENLAERSGISKLRQLNRWKGIAYSDITDMFDIVGGEVILKGEKSLSDLPKELRMNISELKNTPAGFAVKMYCADNALKEINKMLGFNEPDKQEIVSHEIIAKKPDWMKEDI